SENIYSSSFSYDGSGGIVLGGVSVNTINIPYVSPFGIIYLGGMSETELQDFNVSYDPSGSIILSDVSESTSNTYFYISDGDGLEMGGEIPPVTSSVFEYEGIGGLVISGSYLIHYDYEGSSGLVLGGEAEASLTLPYLTNSGLILSGDAG